MASNAPLQPLYIDEIEAARLFGVCPATIKNWRNQRRLPSVKIGGRRLYSPTALEQWAETHAQKETAPDQGAVEGNKNANPS